MEDTLNTQPQPAPMPPSAKIVSPEKKAFLAALAKAQGAYEDIEKNAHVIIKPRESAAYEFDYADLGEILKKTRKALSENGISTRVLLTDHDGDHIWLNSIVAHAEGYEDVSSIQIKTGVEQKTFGGFITYMRRYLLGPQLGVAGEGDTDDDGGAPQDRAAGDIGSGRAGSMKETKKPTPARRSPSAPAPAARQDSGPPDEPPPPEGFDTPAPPAPRPATPPPVKSATASAPDPASPPATAPAPSIAETGELATQGEVAYLVRRAKTRNAVLRAVLDETGMSHLGDTEGELLGKLLKSQWSALLQKV